VRELSPPGDRNVVHRGRIGAAVLDEHAPPIDGQVRLMSRDEGLRNLQIGIAATA
jgi:hypothetical protein